MAVWRFLARRLLYGLGVLLGVNILTFFLFFQVNSPEDMARLALGGKRVTDEAIAQWKEQKGYNLPLWINTEQASASVVTETLFWKKSMAMFSGDFGNADDGRRISSEIFHRAGPSLALALPTFILSLLVTVILAMLMAFFYGSFLDRSGLVICVVLMSISSLFYIIAGQFLFAKVLRWVPISGYGEGLDTLRFLCLPVLVGVVSGLGSGVRWYRTIFLEEMNKDYVRAARARGLSEWRILFVHILKNAAIPIITGSVAVIPLLFMGSLISESFFGIPGLGSYTIEAIQAQDFAVVRAMVFVGSALYLLGLIMTDVAYCMVDPRIRLE